MADKHPAETITIANIPAHRPTNEPPPERFRAGVSEAAGNKSADMVVGKLFRKGRQRTFAPVSLGCTIACPWAAHSRAFTHA